MSFDILVFDPEVAPREKEAFLSWWEQQAQWSEDHGYDDAAVSTPALRAWFAELARDYPAMNGPHSPRDLPEDEASLTDYSIGRHVIYGSFAWSKAEAARDAVLGLAAKHGLGVFEASSDSAEVWFPSGGKLFKI